MQSGAESTFRARLIFPFLALALISLSIAVPGGLFAWMAWKDRARALHDGQAMAQRTVGALHEHALRALETSEVLLRHIDRQVAGRSWEDIEQDARLQRDLAELARTASSVLSISLADSEGRVRIHSREFPARNVSVAGRAHFRALGAGKTDLAIGGSYMGPISGVPVFPMSVRRSSADGQFDGVVIIGVPLDYFTAFWEQFAPTVAHVIPMMREDGELLVRYPSTHNPQRLDPNGPFMQQIARAPSGVYTAVSRVDGIERVNAYTKIGNYPLYVSFSIETAAILASWRQGLVTPAWLTVLVATLLLVLSVVMLRYVRREQRAVEKWRDTARRLASEMGRREAAEETLRQAQKMESIGQITGGVAHDFNNLLQVLSANLHLAARTATDRRAAGYIGSALEAVDRGAKLTRQLLAFSRRQPLSPQPVDVQAMLGDMARLLRTTVGAAIEVKIETSPDTWLAMIDRNQAEMAILNLAVNARDAMPAGGTLTLASGNVRLREGEAQIEGLNAGEYVLVSARDTGTGMSRDVAKRAFEPFFTTKEPGKGSGLGLSQVHGFTAQSGGAAKVESDPSQGTTVELYLPRAHEQVQAKALPAIAAASASPGQAILLVDDDAEVRKGIAPALAVLGHTVIEAGSGPEAVEALRRHPEVTLLITDYAMPGMRGTELAALARKRRADLGVLLISGFADLPEGELLQWDLLRKPFTPEELEACVAEVARGAGPRSSNDSEAA